MFTFICPDSDWTLSNGSLDGSQTSFVKIMHIRGKWKS